MLLQSRTFNVAAGASVVFPLERAPFSVAVFPAAGASAKLELSASSPTVIENDPGSARWVELEAALTTDTLIAFPSPATGLRVSSSVGATVVEVVQ